jgi:hypothetical protein
MASEFFVNEWKLKLTFCENLMKILILEPFYNFKIKKWYFNFSHLKYLKYPKALKILKIYSKKSSEMRAQKLKMYVKWIISIKHASM